MSQFALVCINIIFAALAAAVASYFGARAKKGGEISALSKRLDEVLTQQEQITSVTEGIKSDIEHQVWRKKEQESLLREKIEEVYLALDQDVNTLIQAQLQATQAAQAGNLPPLSDKAEMLLSLYFETYFEKECLEYRASRKKLKQHVIRLNEENYYGKQSTLDYRLTEGYKLADEVTGKMRNVKISLQHLMNKLNKSFTPS